MDGFFLKVLVLAPVAVVLLWWAAPAFERWINRITDPRLQGRLTQSDRVPEPSEILWRRALDRAMSARLIGNPDQFPQRLQCPFCSPGLTEFEIPTLNDPQPLLRLAHHLSEHHRERLNGLDKRGASLAIEV